MKRLQTKIYNILRWSEKYTKTDMLYLVKGGSWLMLGNITAIVSGLVLSVAFANLVPKEVFGNYKFVLSIAGILGAFTLTGMGTAITQAVARGFEGSLKEGARTQLKWSGFIVLLSFSGAAYYFFNQNVTLALSLIFVGIFQPLFSASILYSSFLEGHKNFKTNAIYNVARNIIPATAIIFLILFSNNVALIVFVYFLAITLPAIFFYKKTVAAHKPGTTTDPKTVTYSKHLSAMNILSAAASHLDKILVFHFLGAAQLAIYAFAIALPTQVKSIEKILSSLLLPKLSDKDMVALKSSLPHKALIAFLFGVTFFVLYIIAAPFIYALLFPQYIESVLFSQVFAISILFFPSILFAQTLISKSKKKELYIVRISTHTFKIVSLLVLLPLFGIWGAIGAILLTQSVNLFVHLLLFKKL